MTTKNDITGDRIASKPANDEYRSGYNSIWRKRQIEQDHCQRCGKILGGEGHIHTCTPRDAEPGYSGWSKFPGCTGSCDRGEECRCKA